MIGLLVGTAQAAGKWTSEEVVLEVMAEALILADWGTTLDIARYPNITEVNPVLGNKPSREAVNLYMATCMVLHPIIAHYIPSKIIYNGLSIMIG